ncbi:unnamed protein product [Prorocentrum cordatum]|uniref:Uncharacterized protein n=2 Tax=Prorocentrum cordatum TaxID=2364126 RepID=A0ABN9SV89_9DINO|nr:unnamed protein product [Polarella glacialis]
MAFVPTPLAAAFSGSARPNVRASGGLREVQLLLQAMHYELAADAAHLQPSLRTVHSGPVSAPGGDAHRQPQLRRAYTGPMPVEAQDPSALAMSRRPSDQGYPPGAALGGRPDALAMTAPVGSGSLAGRAAGLAEARASLSSSTYVPSASSSARAAPRAEAAPSASTPAKPTPAKRVPVGLDSPHRSRDAAGFADTPQGAQGPRVRPVSPSPRPQQALAPSLPSSAGSGHRMDPSPEPPRSRLGSKGAADALAQMQLQQHQYAAAQGAHRAPAAAEAHAAGRQPAHAAPDVVDDVRYLKRNVDHLKQKKHFLEEQVRQLDARLKAALQEKEHFRGLFEQVQRELRESRYTSMPEHTPGQELQELQAQLEARLHARPALRQSSPWCTAFGGPSQRLPAWAPRRGFAV